MAVALQQPAAGYFFSLLRTSCFVESYDSHPANMKRRKRIEGIILFFFGVMRLKRGGGYHCQLVQSRAGISRYPKRSDLDSELSFVSAR